MKRKGASNIDMLNGPIAIKIVFLAIPIMLTAVLQLLFNSADMVVIGRFVGSDALAAVGANTFVINLMVNLFAGLSIGSNVVIARFIGQSNKDGVVKAVHTSVLISILGGLFLTVVGLLFAEDILRLIGTPDNVLQDASVYFRIIFIGMPCNLLFNFCSAIMRAKGDTRRPLYVLGVCGFINVLLNLFFVVNCGMAVAGVALATMLTSVFSALTLLWMLMHEHGNLRVRLRSLAIDIPTVTEIARIGIPTGIQGMIFSFSNVIIQGGINSLGSDVMAASTAALNFDYLSYFALSAFGQAGMSFLSQNHGASQLERCKHVVKYTLMLGVGSCAVVSWTCVLLRYGLASFFSTNQLVIEYTVARMLWVLPFYCIHGINEILSFLMRALGYSLVPALIVIICICGSRMVWMLLVFPQYHTYNILNCSYPISWIITTFIMIPVGYKVIRKAIQ